MVDSETFPTSVDGGRYTQVDVTDWEVLRREQLGTKPKRWILDPDGNLWLMKFTTDNQRSDGTSYRKGDDWSERVANGVAGRLGVPAAHTELALDRAAEAPGYGIISKSVLAPHSGDPPQSPEELIHGNQLVDVELVGPERIGHTVEAIRQALDDVVAPSGIDDHVDDHVMAWDLFVGYLLLDAVVGNTDRHEENWAVIDRAGVRRLAPTFDHASCLGFQLDDERRMRHLHTRDCNDMPEAWADRAKSKFEGRPHPVVAAMRALDLTDESVRQRWAGRCKDVDHLVEPIWMIPEDRMSPLAQQFAERVIRRNCHRLLDEFR